MVASHREHPSRATCVACESRSHQYTMPVGGSRQRHRPSIDSISSDHWPVPFSVMVRVVDERFMQNEWTGWDVNMLALMNSVLTNVDNWSRIDNIETEHIMRKEDRLWLCSQFEKTQILMWNCEIRRPLCAGSPHWPLLFEIKKMNE